MENRIPEEKVGLAKGKHSGDFQKERTRDELIKQIQLFSKENSFLKIENKRLAKLQTKTTSETLVETPAFMTREEFYLSFEAVFKRKVISMLEDFVEWPILLVDAIQDLCLMFEEYIYEKVTSKIETLISFFGAVRSKPTEELFRGLIRMFPDKLREVSVKELAKLKRLVQDCLERSIENYSSMTAKDAPLTTLLTNSDKGDLLEKLGKLVYKPVTSEVILSLHELFFFMRISKDIITLPLKIKKQREYIITKYNKNGTLVLDALVLRSADCLSVIPRLSMTLKDLAISLPEGMLPSPTYTTPVRLPCNLKVPLQNISISYPFQDSNQDSGEMTYPKSKGVYDNNHSVVQNTLPSQTSPNSVFTDSTKLRELLSEDASSPAVQVTFNADFDGVNFRIDPSAQPRNQPSQPILVESCGRVPEFDDRAVEGSRNRQLFHNISIGEEDLLPEVVLERIDEEENHCDSQKQKLSKRCRDDSNASSSNLRCKSSSMERFHGASSQNISKVQGILKKSVTFCDFPDVLEYTAEKGSLQSSEKKPLASKRGANREIYDTQEAAQPNWGKKVKKGQINDTHDCPNLRDKLIPAKQISKEKSDDLYKQGEEEDKENRYSSINLQGSKSHPKKVTNLKDLEVKPRSLAGRKQSGESNVSKEGSDFVRQNRIAKALNQSTDRSNDFYCQPNIPASITEDFADLKAKETIASAISLRKTNSASSIYRSSREEISTKDRPSRGIDSCAQKHNHSEVLDNKASKEKLNASLAKIYQESLVRTSSQTKLLSSNSNNPVAKILEAKKATESSITFLSQRRKDVDSYRSSTSLRQRTLPSQETRTKRQYAQEPINDLRNKRTNKESPIQGPENPNRSSFMNRSSSYANPNQSALSISHNEQKITSIDNCSSSAIRACQAYDRIYKQGKDTISGTQIALAVSSASHLRNNYGLLNESKSKEKAKFPNTSLNYNEGHSKDITQETKQKGADTYLRLRASKSGQTSLY